MKAYLMGAAAALALAGAAGSAAAQDSLSFNAAVTSDYVFRGVSQTDEAPALQLGVDYVDEGGLYIGAWASNVDFGDDTEAEIDVYAGYRTELFGFAVDVGAIGYFYVSEPSSPLGDGYEYGEFKVAVSRAVGPATLGVAAYATNDFFGVDDEALYYEVNGAFTPIDKVTITGAWGEQKLDVTGDYQTWNAGVTYALTDRFAIDVRYHDTDVDAPIYDGRVVGTLKAFF
jgi:uncharacterized protein (TIGR02001 family)